MPKISKQTSQLLNRALLSLITGFLFLSMYIKNEASWEILIVAIPALTGGVYFLFTAYNKSKNEI